MNMFMIRIWKLRRPLFCLEEEMFTHMVTPAARLHNPNVTIKLNNKINGQITVRLEAFNSHLLRSWTPGPDRVLTFDEFTRELTGHLIYIPQAFMSTRLHSLATQHGPGPA
jgi:hypothetical protein